MPKKNSYKKPIFRHYQRSVAKHKRRWTKHLNSVYPMPNLKINVGVTKAIYFEIGNAIPSNKQIQLTNSNVGKLYKTTKDNFEEIIQSIFDLSELTITHNLYTPHYANYVSAFGGYFITNDCSKLYRQFHLTKDKNKEAVITEHYFFEGKNRYGAMCFLPKALNYIKDPQIVQFATEEMIKENREIVKQKIV